MKNSPAHIKVLASMTALFTATGAMAAPDGPSYDELLDRIEKLEAKINNMSKQAPASSYSGKFAGRSHANTAVPYTEIPTSSVSESGYYFNAEAVYSKPYFSRNSAYQAQIADGNIRNVEFDYDFETTPRFEFGYIAPTSETGWRARFWHYSADASAPGHEPEDDAIAVVAGGSGIEDIDTLGPINHELEMQLLDLELTNQTSIGLVSYGLRFQRMDQSFSFDSDDGALSSELDSVLVGPTLGLDYKCQLGGNFHYYANGRTSLLIGKRDLDTISDDGNYASEDNPIVFNGTLGTGIIWESPDWDGFYASLGLEASVWAGAGNLMNNNTALEDDLDDFIGGRSEDDGDVYTFGIILGAGYTF